MTSLFNLQNCILLSLILFAIGTYGVIAKRNMLIVLMCLEIMLNAVNLAFVSFNYFLYWLPMNSPIIGEELAQFFVIMIIAVAAAEAAIGLAILVNIFRTRQTTDSDDLVQMKG